MVCLVTKVGRQADGMHIKHLAATHRFEMSIGEGG